MERFICSCGAPLTFESSHCALCECDVGFNPEQLAVPLNQQGEWAYCDNHAFGVCNWLRPLASSNTSAPRCQFNRVIPNLTLPQNLMRWTALERAKKRLLYTLLCLELPLQNGWHNSTQGLLFDFLDDERSQPDAYPGSFVTSGYANGVITLNVLEADDVERTAAQVELRRALSHVTRPFSARVGALLLVALDKTSHVYGDFSRLFGDETIDYGEAMRVYYEQGPPANWRSTFISAYASSHPLEDWAESWSHYLLIEDGLDTAFSQGLLDTNPKDWSTDKRLDVWTTDQSRTKRDEQEQGRATSIHSLLRRRLEKSSRSGCY